ncbi:MAG TPA: PKD domain-containing protein [Puia sp.]|nr:PKD domain-containing protein [Puia sp.]
MHCRKTLSTFSLLLFLLSAYAQPGNSWRCADDKITSLQRRYIPGYDTMLLHVNQAINSYIIKRARQGAKQVDGLPGEKEVNGLPGDKQTDGLPGGQTDSVYTIPVVVHVIYPAGQPYGAGANISYTQIRSQIEALNAAYSRSYAAYNGQSQPVYAQDTRIRFCLAQTPSPYGANWFQGPGGTEYGVRRYPDGSGAYDHPMTIAGATALAAITHPDASYFPFDQYLNIWLVQSIDGGNSVMGYAPRPIMATYPLDGVIFRADIFGDNTTGGKYALGFGLTQGKVLAHEVGHYLGLYHIFQDGCAGANGPGAATDACDLYGDLICDIKPCTTQNVACTNTIYNTCSVNYSINTVDYDMINDYMSYADDDCMNTFTSDQVQRMQATLSVLRHKLWQPANLAATGVLGGNGCIPSNLNALISISEPAYCSSRPIVFSNPPAGNTATSYQWQFPGGTPSSAQTDSVTVSYPSPGTYKVLLTTSDGVHSRSDSLPFNVVSCTLDSSLLYMSNWYFGNFCSIDFSKGFPEQTTTALVNNTIQGESAYPGQLSYIDGTVSLSDSNGHLLFYSNGVSVWNAQQQKITHTSMFGVSDINASTSTCYIPYPGHPGQYFIVGVYPRFDGEQSGVRFVLVDVNANTVTPYQEFQNASLPKQFSGLLTVIPHCNGTDYWLVVKGYWEPDTRFYSFLVTSAGIDVHQSPVISSGFAHAAAGGDGYQLRANRKGNQLILSGPTGITVNVGTCALYDFDLRTGIVSHERIIPDVSGYSDIQTGTAFSPNGDYFYLMRSSNFATNGQPYWLFQYRVSDLQYNVLPTTGFYFGSPFQLGPDNQLYIVNPLYHSLARLSNPDSWGGASFDDNFINLSGPSQQISSGGSLPVFIDARKPLPTHPDFSAKALDCHSFHFEALCFDNYTSTWDFGDGSPPLQGSETDHIYNTSGNFSVTLTVSSGSIVYGSVSKTVTVLPFTVGITGTDSVCSNAVNPFEYYAPTITGATYAWTALNGMISGPSNLSYADVVWQSGGGSGTLQVNVSLNGCSLTASKRMAFLPATPINWMLPDTLCLTDSPVVLQASPAGGIFTGDGVSDSVFSPAAAGKGTHILTYYYGQAGICPGQGQKVVYVTACKAPPVSYTECETRLSGITLAPNPVQGNLIELKSAQPINTVYAVVYNVTGQKIYNNLVINNSIRLPDISQGFYLLILSCGNEYFKVIPFFKF